MQKFIYFFTNVLIVSLLFISCKKKNKFTDSNEYSKEHERLIESLKFNENGPNYPPGYQKVAFQLMIDRMNNPPLSSKNNQGGDEDIPFSSSAAATATFTERGPANNSGRTREIIVDAADPSFNTWYAASVSGGLWKGIYDPLIPKVTWQNITPLSMQNLNISSLTQSKSNPSILYMGTGEKIWAGSGGVGNGIYKSMDSGSSWTDITPKDGLFMDGRFYEVGRILVDPNNPDIVLTHTKAENWDTYIFKSIDGGITWDVKKVFFRDPQINDWLKIKDLKVDPFDFNIQYFSLQNASGVYKSTDAGETWIKGGDFGLNINEKDVSRAELVISKSNPNLLYASIFSNQGDSYLARSLDGGVSWHEIKENLITGNSSNINFLGAQGAYDNAIAIHPYDNNIVYVGGVFQFTINILNDSTRNTEKTAYGTHSDHHVLKILDYGGGNFRILNGSDGGAAITINKSSDPAPSNIQCLNCVWYRANHGYNTSQMYSADKIKGRQQYIGGMQDNGTDYSDPDSIASASHDFTAFECCDGFDVIAHWNNPDSMIATTQFLQMGMRVTNDGGSTSATLLRISVDGKIAVGGGIEGVDVGYVPFHTKLSSSPQDPNTIYTVTYNGVLKSKDFGANWEYTYIKDFFSENPDVEVSLANPNFVWAGGSSGPSDQSKKIYFSKDAGATFDPVTNPINNANQRYTAIYSHPTEDSTVYLLSSYARWPKVLESKDLGQTWKDLSGFNYPVPPGTPYRGISSRGFPDVPVWSLAVMPHDPNIIWVGTDIGLLETTDRGLTWNMVSSSSTGFPYVFIWDMKVKDQGEVVIATHGRGIWTAKIPELESYEPKQNLVTLTVGNSQVSSIQEDGGSATITATVDNEISPDYPLVVSLSPGGTASASDYNLSANKITISSGKTGTVNVTAIQDSEIEGDEFINIDISSVTNGSESGVQQVTITIKDDDGVTGIEAQESGGLISIYPNPSSGIFKIRFNDTWKGNVDLRLLDIFGRSQYMRNIDNSSGQLEHEVDISNKSDGVFFVELSQEDKRVIKKIVKQ